MSPGSVAGPLLAPAMVVAVSPFSIIVAVLLILHTDRPRPNGLAFLAGRLIALVGVTAVCVQAPRLLRGLDRPMSPTLLIGLGVLLLAFGWWVWTRRDRMTEEPRWLQQVSRITPTGAAAIGLLLVLTNPKMLAATVAAGLVIGTAGLGVAGEGGAVIYYSAVASSTVAVPVLVHVAVGARADAQLDRMKEWLHRHSGSVYAAVLYVVGIALLVTGVSRLT